MKPTIYVISFDESAFWNEQLQELGELIDPDKIFTGEVGTIDGFQTIPTPFPATPPADDKRLRREPAPYLRMSGRYGSRKK